MTGREVRNTVFFNRSYPRKIYVSCLTHEMKLKILANLTKLRQVASANVGAEHNVDEFWEKFIISLQIRIFESTKLIKYFVYFLHS